MWLPPRALQTHADGQWLKGKSVSSLVPPEISSFPSRMTFICPQQHLQWAVLSLPRRWALSRVNLHVAACRLRHVGPRPSRASSGTPGSGAGGHV